MDEYIRGTILSIWLREGAQETWNEAESQVPSNQAACPRQFRARMSHLAETGRLRSPDHMNHEDNGIYAVKATCGLRAYGWHGNHQGRRAFIISHVRLKKSQKLDPADRKRAEDARTSFEAESKAAERQIRSVK
jgi:hypothetical protein